MGNCPKEGERLVDGHLAAATLQSHKYLLRELKANKKLTHMIVLYICSWPFDRKSVNFVINVSIKHKHLQQRGTLFSIIKEAMSMINRSQIPCFSWSLHIQQCVKVFCHFVLQHKQRVQGRDMCALGRQRQRGEPKQLLPPQSWLCSALGPGFSPGRALELPVCCR